MENTSIFIAETGSVKTLNSRKEEVFTLPKNLKIKDKSLENIIDRQDALISRTQEDIRKLTKHYNDYRKTTDMIIEKMDLELQKTIKTLKELTTFMIEG